jgi:hypothetical protein
LYFSGLEGESFTGEGDFKGRLMIIAMTMMTMVVVAVAQVQLQ